MLWSISGGNRREFREEISRRGLWSEQSHERSVAHGSLSSAFDAESYYWRVGFRVTKVFDGIS